jgi:hypothetical protein
LEINNKLSDLILLIYLEQIKSNNFKNDLVDAVNLEYPSFKENELFYNCITLFQLLFAKYIKNN